MACRNFQCFEKKQERIVKEMEVKEFVKIVSRMCVFYTDCLDCSCRENAFCSSSNMLSDDEAQEMVSNVEKWANEHPAETNQSKLLELFPNLKLNANGIVDYCPKAFGANCNCMGEYVSHDGAFVRDCFRCKNRFWNSEYKVK